MTTIRSITVILCLSAALTACNTVREWRAKSEPVTTAEDGSDITRPPTVASQQSQTTSESNPEETISFDEWRKQRQEQNEPD